MRRKPRADDALSMFDRENDLTPRKHWVPDKGWVLEQDLTPEDHAHRDRWHAELRRLSQRAAPRRPVAEAAGAATA